MAKPSLHELLNKHQPSSKDVKKPASARNTFSIKNAKSLFVELPPEKRFNASNGNFVNNLMELYEEILSMEERDFRQHVDETRNDFADWIAETLGEKGIASRLSNCMTQDDFIFVLSEEIKHIEDKSYTRKPLVTPPENKPQSKRQRPPIKVIRSKQTEKQQPAHPGVKEDIHNLSLRMSEVEKKIDDLVSVINGLKSEQHDFLAHITSLINEKNEYVQKELQELEKLEKDIEWRRKHVSLLEKDTKRKENELGGAGK